MTSSSKLAIDIKLVCLKNLGVINVLPPPGGPIAPTKCKSYNYLQVLSFSLLSYQPPSSKNYLNISIGG